MSWEGWAALSAIAALAVDIVRRLVRDAHAKGQRMERELQQSKDIDGVGRKVEHIRKELKVEIAEVRDEHNDLRRRVDEIATTVSASHALLGVMNETLNMLMKSHSGGE